MPSLFLYYKYDQLIQVHAGSYVSLCEPVVGECKPLHSIPDQPNANKADHSVGARGESHGSEADQALMFCFYNASNSLASSSICFVLFRPPCAFFCDPECHHKRLKSSTTEKGVFFTEFPPSPLKGYHTRRQGTVSDRILYLVPSRCHLDIAIIGFNDGAVEVHSRSYYIYLIRRFVV